VTLAELRVLEDILREAGFAHLTLWHLRCVEAYLANSARDPERPGFAFDRLLNDLRRDLDRQHGDAEWFNARWMATRGPERESLRRHFWLTPRVERVKP